MIINENTHHVIWHMFHWSFYTNVQKMMTQKFHPPAQNASAHIKLKEERPRTNILKKLLTNSSEYHTHLACIEMTINETSLCCTTCWQSYQLKQWLTPTNQLAHLTTSNQPSVPTLHPFPNLCDVICDKNIMREQTRPSSQILRTKLCCSKLREMDCYSTVQIC